jgi:hypothetical protein
MPDNGGYLADLADVAAIDREALHVEALGVREDRVFSAGHTVLADEDDAVVELVAEVVVRKCRLTLNQLRRGMNLVDREGASAVVAVPDDDLARAGRSTRLRRRR